MALLKLVTTFTLLCVVIEMKEEFSIDDVTAVVGEKFVYKIGNKEFLSTYQIYRIVQRGQKRLPGWLTFDKNSSMLIGYPKTQEVGMYTLRLRAQCIDPVKLSCQDRLSRTFHVYVNEPLKSAESRGRHNFSKHEMNEKWIDTNTVNGNKKLYVEYDINRHGTVLEKTSGMRDSSSVHVLHISVSSSAVHFGDFANYFHNKLMHEKLTSNYYLPIQYTLSTRDLTDRDIHEKVSEFSSDMQYITKIYADSVHNSDTLFPSDFSSMLYSSGIYSVHNIVFSEVFSTNAYIAFASKTDKSPPKSYVKLNRDLNSVTNDRASMKSLHDSDTSKHISDDSSQLKYESSTNFSPISDKRKVLAQKLCHGDVTVFYASLIVFVSSNLTNAQETFIVSKWANFVSKDPDAIFISRFKSDYSLQYDGKFILTAGPGNVVESLSRSVEVSWHLACGFFDRVNDFARVLQHNIEAGRVSQELGFDVIAWYVYTDRPLPKRVKRQAHKAGRQTATPTFSPPVPTTLSEMLTTFTENSVPSFPSTSISSATTTYSAIASTPSILPSTVFSDSPLFTTGDFISSSNDSGIQISTTVPLTFSLTDFKTVSVIQSVVQSSLLSISISSAGFLSVTTSSDSIISSLRTSSLLPSFSYLSLSINFPTQSILLSSLSTEGSNLTLKMMSTPIVSSFPSSTYLFSSSSNPFSIPPIKSIDSTLFPSISTPSISTISVITISESSFQSDYQLFSNTSSILTFVTSSMQSISSSPNTSISVSSMSSSFTTYLIVSSSSSTQPFKTFSTHSSFKDITTSIHSLPFSTYFFESTIMPDSLVSETSSRTPVFTTQFSSELDTKILSLTDLSSVYSSFVPISPSLFTSLLTSPFPSSASSHMSVLSTVIVESVSRTVSISVSPASKSLQTSEFQLSITDVSLPVSTLSLASFFTGTSVILSAVSVSDISTDSPLSIIPTAVTLTQSITSSLSLPPSSSLPVSSTTVEQFSKISSSNVLSEDTKSLDDSFLFSSSRSAFYSQNLSSLETSITVTATSVVSLLSHTEIFSSFTSTLPSFKESSRFEETATSLKPSSTGILYSALSTVPLKSEVLTTVPLSDKSTMISMSVIAESTMISTSVLDKSTITSASVFAKSTTSTFAFGESSTISTSVLAISPTRAFATSSITSEFPVESTAVVTTAAPDEHPSLKKSIDHIKVIVGRYYELQIPEDTFSDKEDGNSRNLSLRISLTYSKPFPEDTWLRFNETSQTLYGIPLKSDAKGDNSISEFTLIAKDSLGQVAKDAISLTYKYETSVNHRISVKLNSSYEKFVGDRRNLIYFAQTLADFYEAESLKFLSFSQIEKGSVIVVWSNNSLFGNICLKNKIQDIYDRVSDGNGTVSDQFVALFTDIPPISTSLEYLGVCLLPLTSLAPPTKSPVSETDNKMWIEIVLPALIAILVIVIIALLLLICCRHRRPSKDIKDSNKPAFLEDRRPIIFPEELEMVDPSLKPKTPLVLPSDYLTEIPPAVPPHGRSAPPYRTPMLDDDTFPGEDEDPLPPPHQGQLQQTEPPPYRLPPPYYNPHRMA